MTRFIFLKVLLLIYLDSGSVFASNSNRVELQNSYWLMQSLAQSFSDLIFENKTDGFVIEIDQLICYSAPIESVELKATRTECTAFTKEGEQRTSEAISLYLNLMEIAKKMDKTHSELVGEISNINLDYVSIKELKCLSKINLNDFLTQEGEKDVTCSLLSVFSTYKKP